MFPRQSIGLEEIDKKNLDININPLEFRQLLFGVIKKLFPIETKNRNLYFNNKCALGREKLEPTRTFKEDTDNFEIHLAISQYGKKLHS